MNNEVGYINWNFRKIKRLYCLNFIDSCDVENLAPVSDDDENSKNKEN